MPAVENSQAEFLRKIGASLSIELLFSGIAYFVEPLSALVFSTSTVLE